MSVAPLDVHVASATEIAEIALLRLQWRLDEAGERCSDSGDFIARFVEWTAEHALSHAPFIARREEEPVGMAWLAVVDRIPGPARWLRRAGIAQSVYVVPHLRNAGIGFSLMSAVIDRARALELDYVLVHPTPRSIPFYMRLGFAEAGSRQLRLDLLR